MDQEIQVQSDKIVSAKQEALTTNADNPKESSAAGLSKVKYLAVACIFNSAKLLKVTVVNKLTKKGKNSRLDRQLAFKKQQLLSKLRVSEEEITTNSKLPERLTEIKMRQGEAHFLVKGGMSRVAFLSSNKSRIRNPLAAITLSPALILSRNQECSVMYLSDTLPHYKLEMKLNAPLPNIPRKAITEGMLRYDDTFLSVEHRKSGQKITLKRQFHKKDNEVKVLQSKLARSIEQKKQYYRLYLPANRSHIQLKQRIPSGEIKLTNLQKQTEQDYANLNDINCKFQESEQSLHNVQDLFNDNSEIELFDKSSNKYTTKTVRCVMNLTDLKVSSEKVGKVINEVSQLYGKIPNAVPSATAVNRIVDSKLALSHKQLDKVPKGKEQNTLYTDETRKYGKCIQTYILTDDTKTSYIF
ncbi:Hypothetical predicted protein [Mytilus galloprovincialis]|uniref:Uncharacterized protein n=1 Tax=Mytilus galloprovincialis TaxID=29158 RepID=A0A8B6FMZ8_MYTGA|nr:Hypothetical predicted protein [Mytilus galloprovincialis]